MELHAQFSSFGHGATFIVVCAIVKCEITIFEWLRRMHSRRKRFASITVAFGLVRVILNQHQ